MVTARLYRDLAAIFKEAGRGRREVTVVCNLLHLVGYVGLLWFIFWTILRKVDCYGPEAKFRRRWDFCGRIHYKKIQEA